MSKENIRLSNEDYPVSRNGFIGISLGLMASAAALVSEPNITPDENVNNSLRVAAGVMGLGVATLVTGYEWVNQSDRQTLKLGKLESGLPLASTAEERPASS